MNEDAQASLERRIKQCLALYDTVYFENARYRLFVWKKGVLEFDLPPHDIPGERTDIEYLSPGDEFAFKVSSDPEGEYHSLLEGPLKEAYEVDFYPILFEAGLLEEDCIRGVTPGFGEEAKAEIKGRAQSDHEQEDLRQTVEGNWFQQKTLIKSVHHDSTVASELNLPFTGDPRMADFISMKNQQIADQRWASVLNLPVLGSLVPIAFPDFGAMSWEAVMDIRESAAGRDLRVLIRRLTKRLSEALEATDDPHAVEAVVRGLFIEELVDEIRARSPKVSEMTANFALNLVSIGGWVGSAAELVKAIEHRQSWVSLLD